MSNVQSLKKTTSFLMKKSASMEIPSPTATYQPPPTKESETPSLEFPTSPQLILGGELLHFSHPQHALSQVILPDLFTCAGCKEYGAGKRFMCTQCYFQLHEFCALAPPALKTHPFHLQHQLLFYSKSGKGGMLKSKCDVCAKPIKGYGFRCVACTFQMHPCCAMLSTEINIPVHPHTLKLLPVVAPVSNVEPAGSVCSECKRRRSGRIYHCTSCEYHLHAVCAKNMVNGLHANGIKCPEKPSMLGTAGRLASQVVIEFIEGLIEGLGEGVGEVLVQSITRGGGPHSQDYQEHGENML
ncbi:C1_3 domain-containing protein [Cephalotus follicularis]|uniref:C1_3 domain-containing protein n=1 Tax=Cephalotus follicularis TaxID=3775 RepID=A0A1Q3BD27_CEPFO|nr:C1_3 domain-containing protein [Cephalotus follicularis]